MHSYRFTAENAISSSNPAVPPGVPVWSLGGREVTKAPGAGQMYGFSPETFMKRYRAGEIDVAPIQPPTGSLPGLWEIEQLVADIRMKSEQAKQASQQRYRLTHARQKSARK